ncbi:LuxR family two component transcriptional regulator [Tamaricihabitans halophyticus]|uniref:LuxR family two component transcriptional regulator n=1 Tax=Tamaricihabitans halophyticus TaxID=1262583 RepID=A0A4R2R3J6_9PSEU|nr:response regulator transcription factor [Tamaricihabitans halophyticus]TCP57402.1 LuxR family two component transcriptional regulator [Tamaricihabitans halophyticus]
MSIRVVLADDQAVVRAGFRTILESEPDISVVGEAEDGHQAVHLAIEQSPDLLLLDVRMPRMDGIAAVEQLRAAGINTAVLMITTFDLDEYVFAALRGGANGFLLKDIEPTELVAAIRVVAAGDGLVAPGVTKRLIAEFARSTPPPVTGPLPELTERERETLLLIAKGMSNQEIATALTVSPATVKTHVGSLLLKLGCRDRVQAVVFAYEHGYVRPR